MEEMRIRITKMLPEDKESVIDMMRVFYASDAVFSNGTLRIFENDINACISDNCYVEGYVFRNDVGIWGYAMLAKSFSTEYGKNCIWIEDLYIKPEARSKGLGKRFFEWLFSTYKDVVFKLEAEKENVHAVSLYKKIGFEVLPYMELIK